MVRKYRSKQRKQLRQISSVSQHATEWRNGKDRWQREDKVEGWTQKVVGATEGTEGQPE